MLDLVTILPGSSTPNITEVAEPKTANAREAERRRLRILELRDAIESGDYRVSAPDLADALLRAARRSN